VPVWNWGQPLNGIIQVAFTVENIAESMETFTRQMNIGPWFLIEHFSFDWLRYRGEPSDIDITIALANSGHMMFELIQQNDQKPSVYREAIASRGYGFHHWAVASPAAEYDAELERYRQQGFELALECAVGVGGRAAYVDTFPRLPGMIELIEVTPAVEALFNHIHQASVGWDGTNAVRSLS
jgi:Glyoxalase/Bleomycin resistance protein/Dioxygenase superfamily